MSTVALILIASCQYPGCNNKNFCKGPRVAGYTSPEYSLFLFYKDVTEWWSLSKAAPFPQPLKADALQKCVIPVLHPCTHFLSDAGPPVLSWEWLAYNLASTLAPDFLQYTEHLQCCNLCLCLRLLLLSPLMFFLGFCSLQQNVWHATSLWFLAKLPILPSSLYLDISRTSHRLNTSIL